MNKQGFSKDGGFIMVPRDFINWEWFENSCMVHLFIYLCLRANYANSNYKGVEVKRGQVITGLNSLAAKTAISLQTIRTCLSRLEKGNIITCKSTNQYTIVTICNFDSLQTSTKTNNRRINNQFTDNQQIANKPLTINQQHQKNDNKEIVLVPNTISKKEEKEEKEPEVANSLASQPHPYQNFCQTLDVVSKMQEQLTFENCVTLYSKFPEDDIFDVFNIMNNTIGIEKKNKSVFLTACNWLNIRKTKETLIGDFTNDQIRQQIRELSKKTERT